MELGLPVASLVVALCFFFHPFIKMWVDGKLAARRAAERLDGLCFEVRTGVDILGVVAETTKTETLQYDDDGDLCWRKDTLQAGVGYNICANSELLVLKADERTALCRIIWQYEDEPGVARDGTLLVWVGRDQILSCCRRSGAIGDQVLLEEAKVEESVAKQLREAR